MTRLGSSGWRGVTDTSLAVGLTVFAEAEMLTSTPCCSGPAQAGAAVLLAGLQTLPIAFRRRSPGPCLLVTGSAALAAMLLGIPSLEFGTLGVLVAFFTVVARSSRPLAAGLGIAVALGIAGAVLIDQQASDRSANAVLVIYSKFAAAWILGDAMRHRAARAAAAERSRIAREVHDVMSHTLSVILAQAGAARTLVASSPETAAASLRSIEEVGRQSWGEVRHLLGLAPDGWDAARPLLERLEQLVRHHDDAGLRVELVVTGAARTLPDAVESCLYRVVQQALTNTLTHAGSGSARVSLHYGAELVRLSVSDAGSTVAPSPEARTQPGRGLAGMRERVELAGGQFSWERRAGGFTVKACIPLPT